MDHKLKDLLDIPRLRELLDTLDEIHKVPSAIIDIEGNILTSNSWQEICTKFHRINHDTELLCIESDMHIGTELDSKTPHVIYR
ncbi:MAG: PocR ligand-binding domain-containing protein, partial [Desulfuromonadaceae bacterium]|nr:PocR ligand-binding domain-containing protein [Desulfuromonadaceae bacterium]